MMFNVFIRFSLIVSMFFDCFICFVYVFVLFGVPGLPLVLIWFIFDFLWFYMVPRTLFFHLLFYCLNFLWFSCYFNAFVGGGVERGAQNN